MRGDKSFIIKNEPMSLIFQKGRSWQNPLRRTVPHHYL